MEQYFGKGGNINHLGEAVSSTHGKTILGYSVNKVRHAGSHTRFVALALSGLALHLRLGVICRYRQLPNLLSGPRC